jgi:hypothetical protein
VFDNVVLGEWVHRQRKLQGDKRLPKDHVRAPACSAVRVRGSGARCLTLRITCGILTGSVW